MSIFDFLSIIFLAYNIISGIALLSCIRIFKMFSTKLGLSYLFIILFISIHSLYILFKLYFFGGKTVLYLIPFSLLYGPFFYQTILNGGISFNKLRDVLHYVPFVGVCLFIGILYYNNNYSIWFTFSSLTYHLCSSISLFLYGMLLLGNFIKELKIKSVDNESFLTLRVGCILVFSSIIHLSFLSNSNFKDTTHTHLVIYFFMTVFLILIIIKLNILEKNGYANSSNDDIEIDFLNSAVEDKYAKSKLPPSLLSDYEHAILNLDDSFFYDPELNLDKLEEHLKIKRYYLTQVFSICLNTSFTKYVNQKKIEYAKKLIKENPSSKLSDIAYQVGFNSVQNFNRAFGSICDMTPKEYRGNFR